MVNSRRFLCARTVFFSTLCAMIISAYAAAVAAPISAIQIQSNPSQSIGYTISNYRVHIHPRSTPVPDRFSPTTMASGPFKIESPSLKESGGSQPASPAPEVISSPDTITLSFFPSDVTKTSTGHVLPTATSHSTFVDCPAQTCWGTPGPNTFINNLSTSNFIHLTDQYVGSVANNRYPAASGVVLFTYPIFAPLGDNDILRIVHDSAKTLGLTGYGQVYHVFLPQGVDVCFIGSSQCYSPDNTPTFAFCAYHSSVTFSDIGHVLFTVEPFQGANPAPEPSCQVPNLKLTDSTANSLSHELFETISDPDVG